MRILVPGYIVVLLSDLMADEGGRYVKNDTWKPQTPYPQGPPFYRAVFR